MKIAIDGPAGAGKSTVAKALAAQLGLYYLDTGAMYRSVAYALLKKGVNLDDTQKIAAEVPFVNITVEYEGGVQKMLLEGEDISTKIRTQEVAMGASKVAAVKEVRKKLVEMQRRTADKYGIVMDGRDIGTAVLPNADYKFYITASSSERAKRRYEETADKSATSLGQIEQEIIKRDYNDMHREISPLCKAEDAYEIDTTHMSVKEVVDAALAFINKNE